ncbi:MAG: hypothetical protein ACLP8S_28135 [Solirubrobacteraceae bacterium]
MPDQLALRFEREREREEHDPLSGAVSESFESSASSPAIRRRGGAGGRWLFADVVTAEVAVGLDLAVVDVGARNAPRALLRDGRGHDREEVALDVPATELGCCD